jgi:uncharacterized Zn-binding protein involved in type VI secretion
MPQISRNKDLALTGHTCTAVVPVIASQFTVFANGVNTPVLRLGDRCAPHTIKVGLFCVFHGAKINQGSSTVFAEGIPVARVGDSTDKGAMIQGAPNVFAGG